ncbi:MAG: S1-like domain-containing RNA-binding protein [Sulfurimonadaceae bacterium]|nr:S1-like domain-containing RNA-binding protein [Sulfurimonadaceae bacterium]
MQINQHLELGKINRLRVDRITEPGIFLMAEDEKDVLLPNQYVTDAMKENDVVEAFLYTDSEDRLVASTVYPTAMLDEYGFFEVVDITKFGAFVDWGLPKDLFVPRNAQKTPFKVGDKRILHVSYDEQSHRLIGEEKLSKYLTHKVTDLRKNSEVDLLVMAKTPMGYKVIVDHKYEGMIFTNEIFEKVSVGDSKKGYVKNIRPDGNLDISLQPIGGAKTDAASDKVMNLLEANNGMLPYNYKSDAELIKNTFGLSKKNFKRALTQLQDAGKIEVKENGIFKK